MKIGIIGPSKLKVKKEILNIARIVADSRHQIIITPDRGSALEYFAQKYIENKGNKVWEVLPLDDKEFGYDWINTDLGEHINCGVWRNQPEKLNEESKSLICLGYSSGVLAEIAYTKWFNPEGVDRKPVYIMRDLVSSELPEEINKRLNIVYVSTNELEEILK